MESSSRHERPQEVTSVLPVPFASPVENKNEEASEEQVRRISVTRCGSCPKTPAGVLWSCGLRGNGSDQ